MLHLLLALSQLLLPLPLLLLQLRQRWRPTLRSLLYLRKRIHSSLSHLDAQGRFLVRDRTRHVPPGASAGQRLLAHRRHWCRRERPGSRAGPCGGRPPSRRRRRGPQPRRPSRGGHRGGIAFRPGYRLRFRFTRTAALSLRAIRRTRRPARVSPL